MAKKFKFKKKIYLPKILIYIIIIIIFYLFYRWISTLSINDVNDKFLNYLNNYYHVYSYNDQKDNYSLLKLFKNKINNPETILLNDLVYSKPKKDSKLVYSETTDKKPLIYIYNTHQKEAYNNTYVEDYNVIPDVLLMSHIMQEKLNNIGIPTIVEENSITNYLNDHHFDYSKSYQASRVYLTDVLKQYSSLKLIIDLHRDAINYEESIVEKEGKKYAKVMFVVGKENTNYQANESVMNALNEKINHKIPNLSRGVLEKEGKGVNGVYNQDMNGSIILLELGSDKNNIDELINTIDLLIPIIKEYINEKE